MIQLLAEAGDGKVAVLHGSQTRQMLTVYQGTDGTQVCQRDFRDTRQWLGGVGKLYFVQEDTLAAYDWESDSTKVVLNFTDCGIDMSTIMLFSCIEDEGFLVGLKAEEGSKIRFVRLVQETQPEEQPLRKTTGGNGRI